MSIIRKSYSIELKIIHNSYYAIYAISKIELLIACYFCESQGRVANPANFRVELRILRISGFSCGFLAMRRAKVANLAHFLLLALYSVSPPSASYWDMQALKSDKSGASPKCPHRTKFVWHSSIMRMNNAVLSLIARLKHRRT